MEIKMEIKNGAASLEEGGEVEEKWKEELRKEQCRWKWQNEEEGVPEQIRENTL